MANTVKLDRLLTKLNNSGIQQQNIALYEVIKELIRTLREVGSEVNESASSSDVIENITNVTNIITRGGGNGKSSNTFLGIPGPKGIPGATGPPGAAGPPTIGPMGINGKNGRNAPPIPGPRGERGLTGIQGPAGSPTIVLGRKGEKGKNGYPIPGSNNVNSAWEFIASQVVAGAANYDFTNLGKYSEILVLTVQITRSAAVVTALQVSTDNGSTFLTSSGDYVAVSTAGVETNATSIAFFTTGTASARSGEIIIRAFNNSSGPKSARSTSTLPLWYMPSITPFNAVRVIVSSGTLNAGTIYVFGRK